MGCRPTDGTVPRASCKEFLTIKKRLWSMLMIDLTRRRKKVIARWRTRKPMWCHVGNIAFKCHKIIFWPCKLFRQGKQPLPPPPLSLWWWRKWYLNQLLHVVVLLTIYELKEYSVNSELTMISKSLYMLCLVMKW